MPIFAGRTLGYGGFNWIGITLALGILFWIPSYIMTFSTKYQHDYKAAEIPTFPSTYGFHVTRFVIGVSRVLAALSMGLAAWGIGVTIGYLHILAAISVFKTTERINLRLLKYVRSTC
jgi:heme O synthase-like polyprenyltransferase